MLRNLGTLVLLLLLATPLAAVAQNTGRIAGTVTDDLGDPLPGANVVIEGTQLGAATDVDGNYFIIGVPVGTYNVTASFVGYSSQTIEGLEVSSGYTTEQNFELGPQELGTIEVTYERPIIQRDAIGVPRVVTGEQLENLPIRGVADVAAIQGGVVNSGRDDDLFIRGGREQEVAYYVDGVKVIGSLGVNQASVQEQEILIGTIPARYGDVQSGVISVTTRSGGTEFFGSAELITSEVLDAYGYNLASLSVGGPIVPGRVSFFVSGQGTYEADYNMYSIDTYRLSDADYDFLQQNPQVVRVVNAAGDQRFIPLPADQVEEGMTLTDLTALLGDDIPEGFQPDPTSLILNAPETYTADQFELERGKDAPRQNLTLNGTLNFDLSRALSLRVGGGYVTQQTEQFTFANSLYNRDRFNHDERDTWRLYGTFRQRLSDNAFYQVQGEYQNFSFVQYPNGFSDDIRETLFYGDIDQEGNPYSDIARRYYRYGVPEGAPPGTPAQLVRTYTADGGTRPSSVAAAFSLPGAPLTTYAKGEDQQFRFSGNATTQLGIHQLEFGGEFEQQTRRRFTIAGNALARFYADDNGPEQSVQGLPEGGVTRYEDLPFEAVRGIQRVRRYGYDYLGLNEVDDQDIDGYYDRTNLNVAPHKPLYYAGYIQDKIEFRDLVINLGARVDVFDNNTQVLRDVYATQPIRRANSLENAPAGVDGDWAVYFAGSSIVGFRDLDGNFYDAQGGPATFTDISRRSGRVQPTDEPISAAFEDYEPQVTFMPRVGVSFPVTDRALFFASYNVTSQRPTEAAFVPFLEFEEITGQNRLANSALEPEITTQYELGFRQRLGERAALTLSGYYRTQENKISVRTMFGGYPAAYSSYLNTDFTTTQGVELGFDLRRVRNLEISANYTLSFAQGTGSDANSTGTAAWRGNFFPNFITPADFDQRHSANVSLDYRFGEDEGPMIAGARVLENFGINILGVYGSGQRYTPLETPNANQAGASFTSNVPGFVNSRTLPATYRIDLRLDRGFDLGFGDARLKAFLWVQNLLDTENVVAVYRATGLPDEDGYLSTSGGLSWLESAQFVPGREFNYRAYTTGPVNVGGQQSSGGGFFYGPPRRVRLGLLLNF